MYIDTHCHLSKEDYEDIDLVIKENRENGIGKIIISGCSKDSIYESIELSKNYDDIYLVLGYHPSEVDIVTDNDLVELENLLSTSKVVGLGEIGLDYYYGKDNKNEQLELFRKQLVIAEKLDFPVVIHSRDAVEDTINMLKEFDLTGVIHCFSGSSETAKIYTSMGYMIGIGGVVTFKNSNLFRVVETVGINNIVLETDSPYLAPTPFRGQKNSSKYIPIIAERVAEILNIPVSDVRDETTKNACSMFDLD